LQPAEKAGAPRHFVELFIGAKLGGRKRVEIDGGSWQTGIFAGCMSEVSG
jgi:hypothetical protein